jgi:hypothetical protein
MALMRNCSWLRLLSFITVSPNLILWRMVYERMLFQLKSVTDVCELHSTKVSSMLCEFCVTDVMLIVS